MDWNDEGIVLTARPHGETGLVVEPDDPGKVADAILQILTDFDFGQRLGEAGRRRVATELNWEVFTRRMLTAFGVTK